MQRDVFAWLFDHSTWFFGGIIAAGLVAILLLGRPRRWWKWLLDAVAVVAVVIAAFALYFFTNVNRALDGRLASLAFTTANNPAVQRLADYRGKVVMVNYWATWCPPCREEMPDVNRTADAWRGRKDVVVLALTDEDATVIEKYTSKHPITATVGRFTSGVPQGAIETMAYRGRPTTLILDREGRVRRRLIGAQSFAAFDEAIRSVL